MATAIQPNKSKKKLKSDNSPSDKIRSADQSVGPLKMVLYARNKQGKTHFAGSSDLKTLIIDCNEKGFETVRDRPNVDVYELDNWAEENDLYWWAKTGNHDYEVFVIDTISSLAGLCMKHVLREAAHDTSVDPSMPQRQHWGKVSQLLNNMITDWRNLPYHILFLAQERKWIEEDDEGDGDGQVVEVTPSLSKAPLQTLLSAVGTIGRLYIRETEVKGKKIYERRMLLGPHDRYMAGTRIKGAPRVMRNPTLARLLEIRDSTGELPPGEAAHGVDL